MWRVFVLLAGVLVAPAWGQTRASCLQQPALVCQASASLTGDWSLSGDITPAQIVATQNNYAPTGFATASVLLLTTDANRILTGLAGGADGRIVTFINANDTVVDASCTASVTPWACCTGAGTGTCGSTGNTFTIQLSTESASSTAANRFNIGTLVGLSHLILNVREAVLLRYDGVGSRWRPFSNGLPRTGVVAGQAGNGTGTVYPRITVDDQGRLTQAIDTTIDALDVSAIDTGIFPFARGGSGASSFTAGNRCVRTNAGNTALEAAAGDCAAASGDVTDVGAGCATGACWTNGLATTGTVMATWEGTTVDANDFTINVPANPTAAISWTVPDGATALTFPTGTNTVATVAPTGGGTGNLTYAVGDVLFADSTTTLARKSLCAQGSWLGSNASTLTCGTVSIASASRSIAASTFTASRLLTPHYNLDSISRLSSDSSADCTGSGAPYACCTGVGTSTCGAVGLYVKVNDSGLADGGATRVLTAGAGVVVTNGDGAAGNPTVAVPLMAAWAHAALGGF